ncbi:MAG: BamA/TamA family outer membrane protein [Bacteroidetes bacterium]|nr:BamA/TamA family outer membrane protein [Bacteroidota bacterium]
MKAFFTLPIRSVMLMLLLAMPAGVLFSQVEGAAKDSVQAAEEIKAEQAKLTYELQQLRSELEQIKTESDGTAKDDKIANIERRISDLELRLDALNRSIESGQSDDWENWDSTWEDDWDAEADDGISSDWKWWSGDGDDEQFDVGESFLKKYPGNFPWLFPMTTRLHETFLRYNRVEGLYIGLTQPKRLYWHSQPWLVSTASLGYGFTNHTWRYSLGLYLPLYFENQIVEIGAEGHSFTDSKDQWSFDRDENTFAALIAREDFLDYFERRGFTASAAWYYRGEADLNLRASIGYAHDTYANMNRATNWSIFGGDKVFRVNPLINDGNVNSIVFSAGLTTLANLDTRDHGWDAQVQYEKAGDFAAGDFSYSQLSLDLRRYQPLGEHLNINLRLRGGVSDGLLPQQRAFELGGPGTLPGYRYKEFAGSSIALVNAEFIIRSTIVGNARGWARNVLSNTNIIFFADAGSTNTVVPIVARDVTNGALPAAFGDDYMNNWKSDVGVAIGSADGGFRIGAAWRLDRSESPMLVLRFSRPF